MRKYDTPRRRGAAWLAILASFAVVLGFVAPASASTASTTVAASTQAQRLEQSQQAVPAALPMATTTANVCVTNTGSRALDLYYVGSGKVVLGGYATRCGQFSHIGVNGWNYLLYDPCYKVVSAYPTLREKISGCGLGGSVAIGGIYGYSRMTVRASAT